MSEKDREELEVKVECDPFKECPEDCPGIVSCMHCLRMRRDDQCPLGLKPSAEKIPANSPCCIGK